MSRTSSWCVVLGVSLFGFAGTAHATDTIESLARQIHVLNRRVDVLADGLVEWRASTDDRLDRHRRRLVDLETNDDAQDAAIASQDLRLKAMEVAVPASAQSAAFRFAQIESDLHATEEVDGYSGVFERLGRFSTSLDVTYSAVGANTDRIKGLEVATSDTNATVEKVRLALEAHIIGDSYAGGHVRRRDIVFVTGIDGAGAPIYDVLSVGDVDSGETFTVDLDPLVGDIDALVKGKLGDKNCVPVLENGAPYKPSGKEYLLCLPLSPDNLYFGQAKPSQPGTAFIDARDAYEMYTGEKLIFGFDPPAPIFDPPAPI